jgi:hypothetical protein
LLGGFILGAPILLAAPLRDLGDYLQEKWDGNGLELGARRALSFAMGTAYLRVRKVSNLILNMNVYIGGVRPGRMPLTKSVDLRGS